MADYIRNCEGKKAKNQFFCHISSKKLSNFFSNKTLFYNKPSESFNILNYLGRVLLQLNFLILFNIFEKLQFYKMIYILLQKKTKNANKKVHVYRKKFVQYPY